MPNSEKDHSHKKSFIFVQQKNNISEISTAADCTPIINKHITNKFSININKIYSLVLFTILYSILMLVNSLLTKNPYSALHSGSTGLNSGIVSTSLYIQSNYILFIVTFIIYANKCKYKLSIFWIPYLIGIFYVISGTITLGLVRNPAAYAYDIILTILVSNISYIDSKRELTNANLKKFLYFVLIITIAGIFMAILRPNIWGFLPISFSRTDRGEIITLGFTGGAAVLPILAFIVKNISFSLRILILILSLGLTLSSGSRTFLYFLISPALIYVFFNTSGRKRIYLSIFTFVILFLFLYDYKDILLNTNERDLNTTENSLNGRGILWLFYWNKFLESPFFGQGAFLLNTFSNSYAGEATSEIGVLKSAAEYGLLLASCQIIVVLLAVANSFKLLKTKNSNEIEIFASYYIILSFPYFIFESLSRINTSNAYFFWYLVFFIYFRQNHYSKNKIPSN